jgi:hypothetical protein
MSGYVVKTVRLTAREWDIIERARSALGGPGNGKLERSTLMSEALLDAGHRLGVYVGSPRPAPPCESWAHEPQRAETTRSRISVSLTRAVADVLNVAAKQVGTSEPRFIVGATLAYIARLEAVQDGWETSADVRSVPAPP